MYKVIYKGQRFETIEKFDCTILSFGFNNSPGGFCTVIPISDKMYRKDNHTKAKVEIKINDVWTCFDITSDHGDLYTVDIHNSLKEEIQYAIKSAFDNNLIKTGSE